MLCAVRCLLERLKAKRTVHPFQTTPHDPTNQCTNTAEVFAALKADLVPLLQRIMASPRFKEGAMPAPLEPGPQWDKEAQVALSKEISG